MPLRENLLLEIKSSKSGEKKKQNSIAFCLALPNGGQMANPNFFSSTYSEKTAKCVREKLQRNENSKFEIQKQLISFNFKRKIKVKNEGN